MTLIWAEFWEKYLPGKIRHWAFIVTKNQPPYAQLSSCNRSRDICMIGWIKSSTKWTRVWTCKRIWFFRWIAKEEVWLRIVHSINRKRVSITYKPGFHKWPDNVWKLENCIKQDVLLSKTNTIDCQHLPSSLQIAEKEIEK